MPVPQVVAYECVYGMNELIVLLSCARPWLQIIALFSTFKKFLFFVLIALNVLNNSEDLRAYEMG